MARSDELMKGFQVGYQNAPFSALGNAIKDTLSRLQQREDTASLYATKYGMEQAFQNPLDTQIKQAQLSNYQSESDLRNAQISALKRFNLGGPSTSSQGQSIFSQFGIKPEDEKYYYPPEPEYNNVAGVPTIIGYKTPKLKPEGEAYVDQMKESNKPYSEIIANKITTTETLVPKIDELIALVERPGNIFGIPGVGSLTGASRIGAAGKEGFFQAFKMGTTMGKGREAAILLKDIRELAFGKGGKTLSENEAQIALSSIDPSYKTEKQWIEGLKSAKEQLLRGKELVSKKPFGQRSDDALSRELERRGL